MSSFLATLLLFAMTPHAKGTQGDVPLNKPFQIVRPVPNHTSLEVVHEGLAALQRADRPIALISVVGPYHSGKSFLLNSLLGDLSVFSVGRQTAPETMGMWLCRTELKAADGAEVWLLDSEGFFGPGIDQNYDAKTFTIASLLGAHILYNTVKTIDQNAVSMLEMLVRQAQLFRARTEVRVDGVPDFLSVDNLPPFTWVIEDFVQDLPETFKREGRTGSLTTYLASSTTSGVAPSESNVSFLTKLYRDVRVHPLFLPATTKEQLRDLSQLDWNSLTPEFRDEIASLKSHLLTNVRARTFNRKTSSGPVLAQAIHFSLQALQQGMFNDMPSLWVSWSKQVTEVALSDAEAWFAKLLEHIDSAADPVSLSTYNANLESARDRAVLFYHKLLRDFEFQPQATELRDRMDRYLARVLPLYHERVRRWIGDQVSQVKGKLSAFLETQMVPMDPAQLEKLGRGMAEQAEKALTAQFREFSAPGARLKLGAAATMPSFPQDPMALLHSDLRALVGKRAHENELELQQLLKRAAAAAGEAVALELRTKEDAMLGRAKLADHLETAERRCWEAFDSQLKSVPWVATTATYRATRALVRVEDYEAKAGRFVAQHDARLTDLLRGGLERAVASYKGDRKSIPMPTAEAEVVLAHNRLANLTREVLIDQARGLEDSDVFVDAMRRLDAILNDGAKQIADKNIQLWKAYSDDATRCAAVAVQERERRSGFLSLFGTVPWLHRRTCRRLLGECIASSAVSSRMSASLQVHVFEMWYSQDMAQSAQRTMNKFNIWVALLAVGLGGLWLWRSRSQGVYYYPANAGYPQAQWGPGYVMPPQMAGGYPCIPPVDAGGYFQRPRRYIGGG